MKKILVNVNEENLEKIREDWAGMRGYRSSNSEIVNELMMSELYKLKQIHVFGTFGATEEAKMAAKQILSQKSKNKELKFKSTPSAEPRTPLRSLMDAYKEQKK